MQAERGPRRAPRPRGRRPRRWNRAGRGYRLRRLRTNGRGSGGAAWRLGLDGGRRRGRRVDRPRGRARDHVARRRGGGDRPARRGAARMNRFRSEIAEQPEVAARLLVHGTEPAERIAARVREAGSRGFVIAARGSSDHAALYAKYLFGARNQALVALAAPSLFTHYARPPRLEGECAIGISQSGESPDVIAVIEGARRQGCLTVAITNQADSKLARAAELVLPLEAGP